MARKSAFIHLILKEKNILSLRDSCLLIKTHILMIFANSFIV